MRAPAGFEQDVMRQRTTLIAAALAAIVLGIAAFVIGLQRPAAQADHGAQVELAVPR